MIYSAQKRFIAVSLNLRFRSQYYQLFINDTPVILRRLSTSGMI